MSDIAIAGIGCRSAGGFDAPESGWDFVVDERDGVVATPAERWYPRELLAAARKASGDAPFHDETVRIPDPA